MPVRISCPGPQLRLFSSWGAGLVPLSPCVAWGRSPACGLPAFASWLCMLVGRQEGAWGGAPLAWVWGVWGWALSHARQPVLGACGRGPLPTGCGRGVCGCGDPSPTAGCALGRAGSAGCGGGTSAPGGGAPPASVRRVLGLGPNRASLGRAGSATNGLWVQGIWACGPATNPTARALACWLCALWGRHQGARGGWRPLPGCGVSLVGRPSRPDRSSLGRAPGARYRLAAGAGGVGVGIRHQFHGVRSCKPAVCAVGVARGRPGGGAGCLGVGRRWLGAHPRSTNRPPGVWPGPATNWLWVRGVWAWEPVTNPRARALVCWVGAHWVLHARASERGVTCQGVGHGWLGAHPRPTARLWGVRPGPATHWLRVRGFSASGPVTKPTARALASWPCALWGRHEEARGGAPVAWVWGVRGRALTRARPPVLGACGRGPLPNGCGCGGCGRWDPSATPQRLCVLAWRADRAAQGRPGEWNLLPWCGASWVGR